MTDLLHVVPDLDVSQYSHILPSLEKALISSTDLLTLDVLDIAKRAHVPLAEVRRLADEVLRELHAQLHVDRSPPADKSSDSSDNNGVPGGNKHDSSVRISTLDPGLDIALGGGFCAGRLSEVTGERYEWHAQRIDPVTDGLLVLPVRHSSCYPFALLSSCLHHMASRNLLFTLQPKLPYRLRDWHRF